MPKSDCRIMKKYFMVPVFMMCFLFSNSFAQASNGADKYLKKNYASSTKTKKNKVAKQKAKPSAKLKNKGPKVSKVGKKYGRSNASVPKQKAKKKKSNH